MEIKIKKAIEEYQCSGCISGHNTECFEACDTGCGCGKHYAGTMMLLGKIFLGMPKGFNRLGKIEDMKPYIFENYEDFKKEYGGGYDMFNIPVWKHLDKNGNTLIRGIQPRLNAPFIHIILGNCLSEINCLEITEYDIKEMH
jgi:hypothetical protein